MSKANTYNALKSEVLRRQAEGLLPKTLSNEERADWVYGNLAASTNHRPTRAAFYKVFVESGRFEEEEFNEWADGKEWW